MSESKPLDLEAMLVRRLEANRLRVPPYPAVALKLQALAENDRCTTRDLSNTIAADAALVAAVVRRANSAASGATVAITSLDVATTRLGVDQLIRIALAQSVGTIANATGALAELRRDVWRRSLLAARMSMELAEARHLDGNAAFIAGLLHDVGAITVLVGLEDLHVELPVLPAATWKIFVDKLQPRFSAVVAERWQLPTPITDAIGHCMQPGLYAGANKPLVELLAAVVKSIAVLDRSPDTGVAALLEVQGLSRDERYRTGVLVREIADFMMTFESPPAKPDPHSAVAPATFDDGWPVQFLVESKRESYVACGISWNAISMRGVQPLSPNWLVPLVLQCEPSIDMLVNVKSCERAVDGTYLIVSQPFGLDGKDKKAWLELIRRTRPH